MRNSIVAAYLGERVGTPDGYYLKTHPLVELRTGKRDSVALIRHRPHLYVAEIMADNDGKFIAVFLEGRNIRTHVMTDDNLQALILRACTYNRLTST